MSTIAGIELQRNDMTGAYRVLVGFEPDDVEVELTEEAARTMFSALGFCLGIIDHEREEVVE